MPDESSRLLLNHTNPGSSSSLRYDSIPRPPSRSNLLHHSNTTGTMTPEDHHYYLYLQLVRYEVGKVQLV